MNLTINIPDDLLKSLRDQASAECRSVSKHIVYLIQRDLNAAAFSVAAAAPKRKLSAKDQILAAYQAKPVMERPFVRHMVTYRHYSEDYMATLDRDAVWELHAANLWAGPDGTDVGSYPMSTGEQLDDRVAYSAATGQNPRAGYTPANPFSLE